MSMEVSLQALTAFGTGLNVTANNVANVSTDEFKASRTTYESGPGGEGVQVQEIRETTAPGPLIPTYEVTQYDNGRTEQFAGYVEGSNTDTATEMVDMMQAQRAYEANAAVIRTEDEMGAIINEMV